MNTNTNTTTKTNTAPETETKTEIRDTTPETVTETAPAKTAKKSAPAKTKTAKKTAKAKKTAPAAEPLTLSAEHITAPAKVYEHPADKIEPPTAEKTDAKSAEIIAKTAPATKTVKEQTADILADYLESVTPKKSKKNAHPEPEPTPEKFWAYMVTRKYPISINGKMLIEYGGYNDVTRAELYKSVISFRRSLLVWIQAREKSTANNTRKNRELFREKTVKAYEEYENVRRLIGITTPREYNHVLDYIADNSLKLARMTRADITQGYRFNSVGECALINLICKVYSINYESNMEAIAKQNEKRVKALENKTAPADKTEPAPAK